MKKYLALIGMVAFVGLAAGTASNRTLQFKWAPNPVDLGGMSTNDYCTNITIVAFSVTDCTVPTNLWPAVASWPATYFLNQGPPGSQWAAVVQTDQSVRFYMLAATNGSGVASPFSNAATWVPAPPAGVVLGIR